MQKRRLDRLGGDGDFRAMCFPPQPNLHPFGDKHWRKQNYQEHRHNDEDDAETESVAGAHAWLWLIAGTFEQKSSVIFAGGETAWVHQSGIGWSANVTCSGSAM